MDVQRYGEYHACTPNIECVIRPVTICRYSNCLCFDDVRIDTCVRTNIEEFEVNIIVYVLFEVYLTAVG